jgi:two-component SAPR family response regulator
MNHGSYVHKDTIMENLWPEHDPTKALPILQTAICRIRNIFSGVREDVVLTYSSSKYCLTLQNTYCDYLEVEKALEEFQKSNDGTYQGIEKAAGLYGKGFLIQESYLWSMGKDEELRKRIGNALRDMIDKVQRTKQDEDVMKYLKLLISLYPYDDEANYTLLNALKQSGKESEMQNHGRWLKKILKEEYDMQPTERIKKLIP